MSSRKERLSQTFNELILNAIKHEAKRGGPLKDKIKISETVWFCIQDALDGLCYDEILRSCINESDAMEIITSLDTLVQEEGIELRAFVGDKQWYPAE